MAGHPEGEPRVVVVEHRRHVEVIDPALARRMLVGLGNGKAVVDALRRERLEGVPPDGARMGEPSWVQVREPGFTRAPELGGRPNCVPALVIRSAWEGTPLQ